MNWDRIEGEWKQRRGKAVRHWGNMMNDNLAGAAGRYEQLVGRLQERYGIATEHIAGFQKTAEQLKKANKKLMDALELMIREAKSNRILKESSGKKKRSETGKSSPKRARSRAVRSKHPRKEKKE